MAIKKIAEEHVANKRVEEWLNSRGKNTMKHTDDAIEFENTTGMGDRRHLKVTWRNTGETIEVSERYLDRKGNIVSFDLAQIKGNEMIEIIASYSPDFLRAIADAIEKRS